MKLSRRGFMKLSIAFALFGMGNAVFYSSTENPDFRNTESDMQDIEKEIDRLYLFFSEDVEALCGSVSHFNSTIEIREMFLDWMRDFFGRVRYVFFVTGDVQEKKETLKMLGEARKSYPEIEIASHGAFHDELDLKKFSEDELKDYLRFSEHKLRELYTLLDVDYDIPFSIRIPALQNSRYLAKALQSIKGLKILSNTVYRRKDTYAKNFKFKFTKNIFGEETAISFPYHYYDYRDIIQLPLTGEQISSSAILRYYDKRALNEVVRSIISRLSVVKVGNKNCAFLSEYQHTHDIKMPLIYCGRIYHGNPLVKRNYDSCRIAEIASLEEVISDYMERGAVKRAEVTGLKDIERIAIAPR